MVGKKLGEIPWTEWRHINTCWLPTTVSKWRPPKSNFSFFQNEFIFYRWRQNECRFFEYSMCPWRDFSNALVEKISEKTKIETKSGMKICHSKYRNRKTNWKTNRKNSRGLSYLYHHFIKTWTCLVVKVDE